MRISIILLFVLCTFQSLHAATFYLDDNGITIKCINCQPGDQGVVDGVTYTAVGNGMITNMIDEGDFNFSSICTSPMTNMQDVFQEYGFGAFVTGIESWDVSHVTNMKHLFRGTPGFGSNDITILSDLSSWDVSNVENMEGMFEGVMSLNGDLSSWDVGNVTNMHGMFFDIDFMPNIGGWDVSSVEDMSEMFFAAAQFNDDIGGWDVSSVTNMSSMFNRAIIFNQDISEWDVMMVADMTRMFYDARDFNQNLTSWCVPMILEEPDFFSDTFLAAIELAFLSENFPIWGPCERPGCTNPEACNYDPIANEDDGSCDLSSPCAGDVDGNDQVDSGDLLLFLADFGCMLDCTADMNDDGVVNAGDLLLFLTAFGTSYPQP